MKKNALLPALVTGLLLATGAAHAADYSASLTSSSNVNWGSLPWSPASPVPGVGDNVLDISHQSASNTNIYLNASTLAIESLGKTNAGNIRFYNGSASTPSNSTFEISGTLSVTAGSYFFRGANAATRLTVNTGDVLIHSGRIAIGDVEANQNVTFNVARTTVLSGSNPVLQSAATSVPNAATYVDLGHVIFRDIDTTGGSAGISTGQTGMTLEMASLRTEGAIYTSAAISGSGTLLISGTLGDPFQPSGENRFSSNITAAVRISKTGNNTQIFARERGNNYSGGTEIGGGILAVANVRNNESALGTGAVTVKNGGTLAGDGFGSVRLGSAQTVTVENGGNIAPGALGDETFSRLAFNGAANGSAAILDMKAGAAFTFRLGADNASDQIFFLGYSGASDLLLDNTVANFTGDIHEGVYNLFVFKSNESSNSNVDALTSISSGLTGGLVLGSGLAGFEGVFHYDNPLYGGTGVISLELIAVPEPGLFLPAVLAGGVWLAARRRRA